MFSEAGSARSFGYNHIASANWGFGNLLQCQHRNGLILCRIPNKDCSHAILVHQLETRIHSEQRS
jgi:hypothetical protein